jgi:glutamate 5-kinase
MGAVPIINENDTISTDELVKITFGDNDILAALVASALRAHLLVLLTVVDGLLDESGKPVRLVESLEQARALVRAEKSALGKGGMNSKLEAARMVTDAGEVMVVANGRDDDVLQRIVAGDDVGTLFAPSAKKRSSRSRWINAVRPAGTIVVDAGAAKALLEKNRSLLAVGIVRVEGDFAPGDIVAIVAPDVSTIARGLSNYTAGDVARIVGKKTADIRTLLGDAAYDEVVHRDNLVLGC